MRPRLRDHVRIHRHRYRGRLWYVMQDQVTGRFSRFSPEAHYAIALMDGTRSLAQIHEDTRETHGDAAPDRDQLLGLVSQLHLADVLISERLPDLDELETRSRRTRRQLRTGRWRSPLAIRIPLLDPDDLLDRLAPWLTWAFGPLGLAIWAVTVTAGAVLAGIHWEPLTEGVTDRVLAAENLVLLFFVFPVVKALHEIGHGIAVKRWGGEVHEMGIMLLVFFPVPYVDASASTAMRRRHQRALVGAAGMLVELFLAALAMIFWVQAEPGTARALAYNVMVVAGISTLLFNGNPLLRFDGYYILTDLIEIPNLGSRSNAQIGAWVRRHLLRQVEARGPATTSREAAWLVFYGIASFIYRMLLLTAIVIFVAAKYFFIGVVLAVWAIWNAMLRPLWNHLTRLLVDPALIGTRAAALGRVATGIAILIVLVFVIPLPWSTVAEGVVSAPEEAELHAGGSGEVAELAADPGGRVTAGQVLIRLTDPILEARVALYRAQLTEAEVRLRAASAVDRVRTRDAREQYELAESRLADAEQRLAELSVRSPRDGVFLLDVLPEDMPGRFVGRGERLGYVLAAAPDRVRVAVDMDAADLVRNNTRSVVMVTTSRRDDEIAGALMREVPAATDRLPSEALSVDGGGPFALDPSGRDGPRSLQPVFQFEVQAGRAFPMDRIDQRVYVKFRHPAEPVAVRWYRGLRQLFLSRFDL